MTRHTLRLTLVIAYCAAQLCCQAGSGAERTAPVQPALWSFYYAWYSTPGGPRQRWDHWSDRDAPADNPRPLSAATPLIGPYDSDDRDVVRWHIRLAKAAGIDAFLVSWWGDRHVSGEVFTKVILPIAAEEQFAVAVCNELAQFHQDLNELKRITAEVIQRSQASPAYLRVDGKPVMYLYQVPFAPKLSVESCEELRRFVESEVGSVYWVMDKVTNVNDRGLEFPDEWLRQPGIDMLGFYGTFSVKRIWQYADLLPHYRRLVDQGHAAGRRVILPVHPGHDNSVMRPNDHFIIPRDDGATLRGYLRAATEARADVIALTSFNEWPETTIVEPSSSWDDPYRYLKLVAEWKGVQFVPPTLPTRPR